uniref:Uncharacterized protein n=1 Tax=Haemonchus placei TaxID=6290 RepID=A0A0N4VYS1_HAEPC
MKREKERAKNKPCFLLISGLPSQNQPNCRIGINMILNTFSEDA